MYRFIVELSPREKLCLYYAACDLTSKKIAEKMQVSFQTVKSYRRYILRKLDCQTMSGAVTRAFELNVLNPASLPQKGEVFKK